MINWYAFTWQAFATIFTGLAAVSAATFVAWQQVKLKRQELRLSLFDKRHECLSEFRSIRSDFNLTGKFSPKSLNEIRRLLNEVKLLFSDDVVSELDSLWDAGFWHAHHNNMIKEYRDDGLIDDARKSATETSENMKKALNSLSKTLELLEDATRIDGSL